jgi:Putative porin
MTFVNKFVGIMAGVTVGFSVASTAMAQVSADALLDKLVAKGILKQDEAADLKSESLTNNAGGTKFKLSDAIKSVELYGDLRMRYEYRSAQLAPGAAGPEDTDNRWRYALRLGVRGDLQDNFYYGLRLETSQNERSTWNTFGSVGTSPYNGPYSKSSYSLYVGLAYLGWRPTSWLDISLGRVPQPLYTTSMVWDSDYTPEGIVEKLKYTYGPVDYFATLGQYIYQDTSPGSDYQQSGGSLAGSIGDFSDNNAYLFAWQLGATYHIDTNLSVKVAPVFYNYVGHGTGGTSSASGSGAGFSGAFVGQGIDGYTFLPGSSTTGVPGAFGTTSSYNQTGINNLFIFELPMEVDFKIGSLDAKAFGDFSINLEGDDRARAAYGAAPSAFPSGVQLNQDQALQMGLAVGNNLGLVYGTTAKKGTWEARVYWQHVEQYALDPNLLDSDFFEGRGNLQGVYAAFAYSFTDGIIGTVRYGVAERINDNLGTGGYNADLPLPNPIDRFQILQMDATWKF